MIDVYYSKEKTVCFSGHRPEKLPSGGDSSAEVTRMLKSLLYDEILKSIQDGYNTFVTGLANGFDTWAAEIIIELKSKDYNIRLVSASPYENHGAGFSGAERWARARIIENSDEFVNVSKDYDKYCMKRRNEYMVNRSSKLIAMVSDYKSGTGQTIRYAKSQGLELKIFNLNNILTADTNQLTFIL
jgi:uncharacterized phage-like protein YoqJ